MTPQELRRLAAVCRAASLDLSAADEVEDLATVATFLEDTATVLDNQARIRRRKAANATIEARRQRARADRRRRPGRKPR